MRYNGLQRGSRKTEGPRCGGDILNGRTAPATLDERSGSCRATSRRMGVSVPPRGTVARNAIKRGVTHERGATKPSVQVRIQVGLAHRKRQPGQQAVADAEVAGEGRTHRRSTMGVVQPAVETRREVQPTEQRRGSRQRACSEAKAKTVSVIQRLNPSLSMNCFSDHRWGLLGEPVTLARLTLPCPSQVS